MLCIIGYDFAIHITELAGGVDVSHDQFFAGHQLKHLFDVNRITEMIDVGIQTNESLYKGKHVSAIMITNYEIIAAERAEDFPDIQKQSEVIEPDVGSGGLGSLDFFQNKQNIFSVRLQMHFARFFFHEGKSQDVCIKIKRVLQIGDDDFHFLHEDRIFIVVFMHAIFLFSKIVYG